MPFYSLKYFLFFLPAVYLVFYFAGERARWAVLLTASLLFYAALNVPYLPAVLAIVALTTYAFGIWLARAETPKAKSVFLWVGIAANLLILAAMKYLPFISENLKALSAMLSLDLKIPSVKAYAAVGVSYYVFQAISYLLDIHSGKAKAERHFGYFALYMAFFPKLMQGPLERAGDLLPQLKNRYEFNYDNMRAGMVLFAWGFFKKVVLADRLGSCADTVYNDVYSFTGLPLLLATYAYAFQIYMDFYGYTDMALGSAKLFNIDLTRNFNSPYLAASVADFWRRWHISFSRWILDYIFKPLQIRWRNWPSYGTAPALIVTFLAAGIWHGARWGFLIFGGLHGLYMASSVFYKPFQKKLYKMLGIGKSRLLRAWQIFATFNLVCLTWVFFRAANLKEAAYIVRNLFSGKNTGTELLLPAAKANLPALAAASVLLLLIPALGGQPRFKLPENTSSRWALYYVLLFSILFLGKFSESKFIYFQF
jgi:alginate O-acetyltransferase complex protein AlgI